MSDTDPSTFTAFAGPRRVARGPIAAVAVDVQAWLAREGGTVLIFDDLSGAQIDLDLRGSHDEVLARLADHPWLKDRLAADEKRAGPGRPRLGVVSREVSLLPRHWDWLNAQSGGASAALRKLVETQMRAGAGRERARQAAEAASKFMWTMAGNMADFEEAARAFSRKDYVRFEALIAPWPADIRDHVSELVATAARADEEADDGH
jgi:hypothetical protein